MKSNCSASTALVCCKRKASFVGKGCDKMEKMDCHVNDWCRERLPAKIFPKILFLMFLCLCLMRIGCAHGYSNYYESNIFTNMRQGDKAAILMVHFGTTHNDTRQQTIEALDNKVRKAFPGIEVREAFTSRIIIKRLGDRGISILNPEEALHKLHNEGFTHVLIQESNIIDGVEVESLLENINQVKNLFKEIRVGDPLLFCPKDYDRVIDIITKKEDRQTAYIIVGHGTYNPTTAQYAMLDYMLKAKGYSNFMVGTIEGYPGFDDMMHQLRLSKLKRVVLIPFMFVAGEHAHHDIAKGWLNRLKKEGYQVSMRMVGLGQYPEIQDMYLENLMFIMKHRKMDILEKKAIYRKTGKRME